MCRSQAHKPDHLVRYAWEKHMDAVAAEMDAAGLPPIPGLNTNAVAGTPVVLKVTHATW